MAVIKFQKREEPEILFGIKLPEIVKNLYYEIKKWCDFGFEVTPFFINYKL